MSLAMYAKKTITVIQRTHTRWVWPPDR